MQYSKQNDFDLYKVTGRDDTWKSNNTLEIIQELNNIQSQHNFKFRYLETTIQQAASKFLCYFTNKNEFENYYLPKILCKIFDIDVFDMNSKYKTIQRDFFEINWLYDVYRLYNTNEFVSTIHVHWFTKHLNKCHPGYGRLSLCAFEKHKLKKIRVVISDYSKSFEYYPLLTDKLQEDEDLFYSGVNIIKHDQPYFELFERENKFNYRTYTKRSECKFEQGILYIDDEPVMEINSNRIAFIENVDASGKATPVSEYKTLEEFKQQVTKRS